MAARKLTLDWIRTVLADSETIGERSGDAPLPIVERPRRASSNRSATAYQRAAPRTDDQPFCVSWQLIRIAAARPGGLSLAKAPVAICATIHELPHGRGVSARMTTR
jgi:hypothetical protein